MKKFSFPPITDTNSKILILGTMPSERSLSTNQYYAHRNNQFWKIMFSIFNMSFSDNYTERVNLLIKNKVALWDVLMHCEREGSSDNRIQNETPNDFNSFFAKNKKINQIFFNGANAYELFTKLIVLENPIELKVLPSTSPANIWKNFDQKLSEWSVILKS